MTKNQFFRNHPKSSQDQFGEAPSIKPHQNESKTHQKTYSRTSKMEGYFELKCRLSADGNSHVYWYTSVFIDIHHFAIDIHVFSIDIHEFCERITNFQPLWMGRCRERAKSLHDHPASQNDKKMKISESAQINPGSLWEGPWHQKTSKETQNNIPRHQRWKGILS